LKDHIDIHCQGCGRRISIGWPTPRSRRARVRCEGCGVDFSLAEAVERTIIGAPDATGAHAPRADRLLHLVPGTEDSSD
jgi:hypothetical protein